MKLAEKAREIKALLTERKRLRSPAPLRYAIADGIGMLDPAAWDALTRDAGFFLSRDYLSGLEAFTQSAACLTHLSYRSVETEPNMVLTVDPKWNSHDDYLASLASKYRSNVRNAILKPMDEAGCAVQSLTDITPHLIRIHALYEAVQANADLRPFLLPVEYFAVLQRMAGARFRCSVVNQGDTVLGFLITIADGETAIAYHIGFDREAAGDLPIYLRLLHAGIADAITLNCKRVSFGRTALEPKAALGAKPQPFSILLRHRQPVLNKLIKRLLLGIEHDDAPDRNPFKKAAGS